MVVMGINALVQKHNVIVIIVNVFAQAFFALIVIAKIAKINLLKIMYQIDVLRYPNQKLK